jgi:PKD repeat protein
MKMHLGILFRLSFALLLAGLLTLIAVGVARLPALAAAGRSVALQDAVPWITKTSAPAGAVEYGDELTYTVVVSASPGAQLRFYDALSGTHFLRFAPPLPGVMHADGVITGALTVTPTAPVTVGFVVRVGVPGTAGYVVSVTNRACVYPITGTVADDCTWSEWVTNRAIHYVWIYLPLVMRSYEPIRADFTAQPTSGGAPLVVTFTNTSGGAYTHSLWRFGDGITSTRTHPTHTYTAAGAYSVTLAVSQPDGTVVSPQNISTLTKPSYITVYTAPLAPSDLQATPVSWSQIRLNWKDNSPVESGFHIYDGGTWIANVAANTVSYTVGGLKPQSYHCYRVRAFNDHGTSDWSDWGCATTLPCSSGIANGGFETDAAWEFLLTAYPAAYTTAITHTGSRAARTGIVTPAHNIESWSVVQQVVTIPAGVVSATLRFWVYPISGESPYTPTVAARPLLGMTQDAVDAAMQLPEDMQYVIVLNEADQWIRYLLWRRGNEQRWIMYERDMSIHAGQTIKIQFGSVNDGFGGLTAMYVDDVSLELCEPTQRVVTTVQGRHLDR